jgi:UDP-glucose 4-epimerase
VVDLLAENGHSVRLFSRRPELPERLRSKNVQVFPGDLEDADSVLDAMEGMDVFFHIGEIKNTSRRASARNIRLVEEIAEHLAGAKVKRFVFISSITVAGVPAEVPADEETEPGAVLRDQYTEYKRACERIIAERCSGAEYVILRPAFVYGPRSRYLRRMIEMVRRLGPLGLTLIGAAKNLAPFVQVQDLAAAVYLAGTRPDAAGKVFNITDGQAESWSDFLEAITAVFNRKLRIIPVPTFLVRVPAVFADIFAGLFGVAADLRSYVSYFSRDVHFGNGRAVSVLDWKPLYTDLAAGVREMVEWYSKTGKTVT